MRTAKRGHSGLSNALFAHDYLLTSVYLSKMESISKKSRKSYDKVTLNPAFSAIKDGEMSIRSASVDFNTQSVMTRF